MANKIKWEGHDRLLGLEKSGAKTEIKSEEFTPEKQERRRKRGN